MNASADYLNLAVSPSGPAALVWSQSTAAVASVKALYGTSATGVWGQTEDVSASATTTPVAAIGDDGSVVATWEHFTAGGSRGGQRALRGRSGRVGRHPSAQRRPRQRRDPVALG